MSSLLFYHLHSCPPSSSVITTHVLPPLLSSALMSSLLFCYLDYILLLVIRTSNLTICFMELYVFRSQLARNLNSNDGTYATSVSLGSWHIFYFSITWQLAHMLLQYHLAVGTYATSVSHGSWHIYYFSITWQICYFSITWHMYVKFQALITNRHG